MFKNSKTRTKYHTSIFRTDLLPGIFITDDKTFHIHKSNRN